MNMDSVDSSIRLEAKYNPHLMECCKLLGLQPRRQTKSPSSCQLDTLFLVTKSVRLVMFVGVVFIFNDSSVLCTM